jgi:hypothetical protein
MEMQPDQIRLEHCTKESIIDGIPVVQVVNHQMAGLAYQWRGFRLARSGQVGADHQTVARCKL